MGADSSEEKIVKCSLAVMRMGFVVGLFLIFTAPTGGIDEGNRFVVRMLCNLLVTFRDL